MEINSRLEKMAAPVLVGIASFGIGYAMQQNRAILDQAPSGFKAAFVFGNGAVLCVKDVFHRSRDNDLGYLAFGNAAGTLGYFSGVVKDCLTNC